MDFDTTRPRGLYTAFTPAECVARAQAIAEGERPGGYVKDRTANSITFEVDLMPDPQEWLAMGCLTVLTVGLGLIWIGFRVLFALTNKMEARMVFLEQGDGRTAVIVDSRHEKYRKELEEWARKNLVA